MTSHLKKRSHPERRAAPRHILSTGVRFLLRGSGEGVGKLLNISERGLAISAELPANKGDDFVGHIDGIGRFPGHVARVFDGGFSVEFDLSASEQKVIKSRISAALEGLPFFRLSDPRTSIRMNYNIETMVKLENVAELAPCTIVDMSKTGCRVQCRQMPEIGSIAMIGALKSIVRRHCPDGFAVEFLRNDMNMTATSNRPQNPRNETNMTTMDEPALLKRQPKPKGA